MQNITTSKRGAQFLASEIDFKFGLLASTIASGISVANCPYWIAKYCCSEIYHLEHFYFCNFDFQNLNFDIELHIVGNTACVWVHFNSTYLCSQNF